MRAAFGERPQADRATSGRPSAGLRRRGRPAATAPQPEPRPSSPPVAAAAIPPARNSPRGPAAAGCRTSGASRGAYSRGSRPINRNVPSRSARRCSAGRIRAKSQPSPFGERMKRRVLQELRGAPFDPGVRRLRESRMELLDETRLAEAGLADDQYELALACASALPAARQQGQFLLAADEGRERPRAQPVGRRRWRERCGRAGQAETHP